MMNYSYAVLGTGALGGFYGARLQQAGATVHFLLRSDYEQVRKRGLIIESPDGNFTLPQMNAYAQADQMPAVDMVVIALKTTQNHLLSQMLPPLLHDHTQVLVLQNGLDIEPQVAEIVGSDRVIGGLCFLCSNKVGPGHIRHLDYKAITLGEYRPGYAAAGIGDRLLKLQQDFEQADIPIELCADLLLARWKKLVWNIPFNGLSVVLNAQTNEMMTNPASRALAIQLMEEVVAGAAAYGRQIDEAFVQRMISHTEHMKPYRTSMKIDFDERRPLEVEAIMGNPWRAARAKGVDLPQIQMLYQQLIFLDAQRRRGIGS
jgi:2-dehydropantoate 2-reductase